MIREMGRNSSSLWNWMILAGITALAAVLRLWQINESLWVDELHTSWCVQGGFWQVAERAAAGNQSPAYFYLVWGITRLLGESEFTLRLPSLLAGIALPGVTWLLVRRVWKVDAGESADYAQAREWSALLTAFLIAVDHASMFYATEARPFAIVELLAALDLLILLAIPRHFSPKWEPAFVGCNVLLFYFQYTAALFLAAMAVVSLVRWNPAKHWKPRLLDWAIVIMLCLPALLQLLEIAGRRGNWGTFIDRATLPDLLTTFPFLAAPLGLGILVAWQLLKRPRKQETGRRLPPEMTLVCGVCLLPILVAWGLTSLDVIRLFHPRYLVAALPALWSTVAAASQVPPSRLLRVIATIAIAYLAVLWSGILENYHAEGRFLIDRREDWRSAVAAAEQEHRQHPHWKILVHSGLIETDALRQLQDEQMREYGLLPVKALYPLNAEDKELIPLPMSDPGQLTTETRDAVLQAGGAVIILRLFAVKAVGVEKDLVQAVAEKNAAVTVIRRQGFGDVQVITVQVRRDTTRELAPGSSPNERPQ
jgi:mannosyltransferase